MIKLTGKVVMSFFIPLEWGHGGSYLGNVFPLDKALEKHKGDQNPFNWIMQKEVQDVVLPGRWNSLVSMLAGQNHLTIPQFIEFVNWCERNKRTVQEVRRDDKRHSIDLWITHLAKHDPSKALWISHARETGKTTDELMEQS